jgi:phosphoribosylanthranilate isomerase
MQLRNLIQVAGIIDQAEADLLLGLGVKNLVFPMRLPVNKVDLSEEAAATIAASVRGKATPILLTYIETAKDNIEFCDEMGVSVLQLHGEISVDELRRLKSERPDLIVIKSLVVGLHGLDKIIILVEELGPYVDAFITDTFNPKTGARGATGLTHDWDISRKVVELSGRPVILAGGLNPANVKEAILKVRPAGVDVHTGVEGPNGRKDVEKMSEFLREATEAFESIDKQSFSSDIR